MTIDARTFFERVLTHGTPPITLGLKDVSEEGNVFWDYSVKAFNHAQDGFRLHYFYDNNPSRDFMWDMRKGSYEVASVTYRRSIFGCGVIVAIDNEGNMP